LITINPVSLGSSFATARKDDTAIRAVSNNDFVFIVVKFNYTANVRASPTKVALL